MTKSFTQQSCVSITKSPLFSAESDPEWEQHRELVWTNCASQRSPSLGTKALVAVLLSRTSALRSEMMDGIPHKKKDKTQTPNVCQMSLGLMKWGWWAQRRWRQWAKLADLMLQRFFWSFFIMSQVLQHCLTVFHLFQNNFYKVIKVVPDQPGLNFPKTSLLHWVSRWFCDCAEWPEKNRSVQREKITRDHFEEAAHLPG